MRSCAFLRLLSGLALAAALALPLAGTAQQPTPDSAQTQAERQRVQPGNNAPVWREVQSGQEAYTSVKGQETNVLIQPAMKFPGQPWTTAGEAWRLFRNNLVTPVGGWLVALVLAVIGVFYWWKGPARLHEPLTGRLIQRFTPFERYIHWVMAITFCILGVTGLIILLGKHVLLPIIGYTLFAWLTSLAKNVHNFVGPIFVVSLVVFIVRFIGDNLPRAYDLRWFKSAGGMFGGEHVPSGKYNAGEKVWFWFGVVLLSTLVSISGLILNFPNFDQVRAVMIQANIVHAIAAIIVIVMSFGHIFLGTIGVDYAYQNMRYGYTDETWAKEHHGLWYHDVKSGKVKAEKATGVPAAPQVQS
jgi:formate dehydrogenase subunit gamma